MPALSSRVPFNRPHVTGREFEFIGQAIANQHLSGDGPFTRKCQDWLERRTGCRKALMTHSCTAALEMAAILSGVGPGDEVIMPSYTFVSTANAFVLRGAVPVFVDIRPDTLNIDERLIEGAITPKTKAIVVVHYAGVACEMGAIAELAARHGLLVIEDAAQGVMSEYNGKALGSLGHLAALSFHETKNVISGEGGALLINDDRFIERAEIVWEKGTNRRKFFRGQVDKYTWVDIGSSFLPGEVVCAFLWAQLLEADAITAARLGAWEKYHRLLVPQESGFDIRLPRVPAGCRHNAHMYYVLVSSLGLRARVLSELNRGGVNAVFHYVPLHSSPAGLRFGRSHGPLPVTDDLSSRLLRLPLWVGIDDHVDGIVDLFRASLGRSGP
jgi:dTDP-4-amino-4,6-dideoxygalactose transaminase